MVLTTVLRSPSGWSPSLETSPKPHPLDLYKAVGQLLLMGIPDCDSLLYDGSNYVHVAVAGVNASGAATDVSVEEGTDLRR